MIRRIGIGLVCLAAYQSICAQGIAPFEKGDRVVFAGNSITEAGLYANNIWLYYLTRFPDRPIRVFNGGIGGDVSAQILARLDADLLVKDPDVLVVTFGMNDSRYFEYGDTARTQAVIEEAVATSKAGFDRIVDRLQRQPRLRTIVMSSSPYDETVANDRNLFKGKSIAMERIAGFQQEAAARNRWGFVDLLRPMQAINERGQEERPDFTITGPDRIHPGSAGHLVMAYLFLKAQGLAGRPVADVALDAGQARVTRQENASVRNLAVTDGGLSFDYLAGSLPFPIDTVPRVWENPQTQRDALHVVPFMDEFNSERLAVAGLAEGRYAVGIGGEYLCDATASELAAGINLAEYPQAPQYRQARRLLVLNRLHAEMEQKYRNYFWVNYNFLQEKGLLFDDSDAARDTIMAHADTNGWLNAKRGDYETVRVAASRKALDREMARIRKQLYRLNKPVTHRITITRKAN